MRTRQTSGRLASFGFLFMFLISGSPVFAQEGPFPELDGHRFSPASIDLPWTNSFIVSNLGVGSATSYDAPPFVIDGDTIPGLQGDLLYATLELEYQQKIVDWFAFRIGYRVDARLGTQLESLLSKGVNTVSGFEIGWLARLLESERDMLSLDFRVSNKDFTVVDIAGFVEDVVDGIDASIVSKNNAVRAATGLKYAHAFSHLFGIAAIGEFGLGESAYRTDDDELFYRLGGQLDFDLASWRDIPLNAALGFITDSYPEAAEDVDGNVNSGFLRLSYIARNDFTVGLELATSRIPVRSDDPLTFSGVTFDLRYYF